MKQLSKITQSQINAKGVQSLSDRPNAISQYGASGLSPHQLKLAFDKLATFLAGKINEVVDTLSSEDAADYIRLALDEYEVGSLEDLISAMLSGSFAEKILQVYPSANSFATVSLQRCINDIAQAISENMENIEDIWKEGGTSIKDELDADTNILNIRLLNKKGEEISSITVDLKVNTDRLVDGAITTEKIKSDSVTAEKLAIDSVSTEKIKTGAVTSDKLDDNSIKAEKIQSGAITTEKLSPFLRNKISNLESEIKGKALCKTFMDYSELVEVLNAADVDEFSQAQHFLVKTLNVPDVWVYEVSQYYYPYVYVDDETFALAVVNGLVQVGYYVLSALETQKVDLSDITSSINGTVREIVPNEHGVFPISEVGTYNIHIEWTESSREEDGDTYNIVEIFLANEEGRPIDSCVFAKNDINAKYYDGEFYVPINIEEPGVVGVMVDAPRVKSVSITTSNPFSSSTNRQFSEIKEALGSYITDIDTLLGGE